MNTNFYHQKKSQGRCANCGRICDRPGKAKCSDCASRVAIKLTKNRQSAIQRGICHVCEDADALPGIQMCHACKTKHNLIVMRHNKKLKREVMDAYGGICACCGETNLGFLTIDHLDDSSEKAKWSNGKRICGSPFYSRLKLNDFPSGYQVLCFNCNCGRAKNHGVCPHKSHKESSIVV
jgi:hypothetical protein